jgi:hypothetical protein
MSAVHLTHWQDRRGVIAHAYDQFFRAAGVFPNGTEESGRTQSTAAGGMTVFADFCEFLKPYGCGGQQSPESGRLLPSRFIRG